MDDIRPAIPSGSQKFIHGIRRDMRDKGYAYQTEKTYVHWIKRFICFHNKRHPARMGAPHINRFLSSLGHDRHCSPATQRIALNALVYLYRKYLGVELETLDFERSRQRRPALGADELHAAEVEDQHIEVRRTQQGFGSRRGRVAVHDRLAAAAEDEATVALQTMVGVSKDERALSKVSFAVRKRLPWLQINLLTAFLAAAVVGIFVWSKDLIAIG